MFWQVFLAVLAANVVAEAIRMSLRRLGKWSVTPGSTGETGRPGPAEQRDSDAATADVTEEEDKEEQRKRTRPTRGFYG